MNQSGAIKGVCYVTLPRACTSQYTDKRSRGGLFTNCRTREVEERKREQKRTRFTENREKYKKIIP